MSLGIPDRRQFLGAMATVGAMAAAGKSETFSSGTGNSRCAGPNSRAARCWIAFIR